MNSQKKKKNLQKNSQKNLQKNSQKNSQKKKKNSLQKKIFNMDRIKKTIRNVRDSDLAQGHSLKRMARSTLKNIGDVVDYGGRAIRAVADYGGRASRSIINNATLYTNFLLLHCDTKNDTECFSFDINISKQIFMYDTFNYLTDSEIISSSSANGLISKLTYTYVPTYIKYVPYSPSYTSCCVLKTSLQKSSDNLVYEFLIGKNYINDLTLYFPCFLETFDIYTYEDNNPVLNNRISINEAVSNKRLEVLKKNLIKVDISSTAKKLRAACSFPHKISILMQYGNRMISLYRYVRQKLFNYTNNSIYELVSSFFQVYSVLSILAQNFTHHDLHGENIQLYEIPNNKYVKFIYTLDNGTKLEFYSKYIAKIIDYGRAYVRGITEDILRDVKDTALCPNIYTENIGFSFIMKTPPPNYTITPFTPIVNAPNRSADLCGLAAAFQHNNYQLQNIVLQNQQQNSVDYIKELLYLRPNQINWAGDGRMLQEVHTVNQYNNTHYLTEVNNVSDASYNLINYLLRHDGQKFIPNTQDVIGTINIYSDNTRMNFEENSKFRR